MISNFKKLIYFDDQMNFEVQTDCYLTIESLADGLQVKLSNNACQYSLDTIIWNDLPADTDTPIINNGEKIYFKGELIPNSLKGIGTFTISKRCNVLGNIMSMLYGDNFKEQIDLSDKEYTFSNLFKGCSIVNASQLQLPASILGKGCYYQMFYNCSSLVTAPELPATTLASSCYNYMFNGCRSLVSAPSLPATTLASGCYQYMFSSCSKLTTAPELPATKLADYCYYSMFKYCSKLTRAPELPATTLTESCYDSMFSYCYDLVNAPALPATTLVTDCYYSMFSYCSSLTTAPNLPATTLVDNCYGHMFQNCYNLVNVPVLPATKLTHGCYSHMFQNCTKLVQAPKLPATTLAMTCYWYMFDGCTSLTTAPELPATILDTQCYQYMFQNCTSLVNAPALPAITLAYSCYSSMFSGCESLVNAPELPATKLANWCYGSMFKNCTSLVTAPELPATTLVESCYKYMFQGCARINYIKALFTTTPNTLYNSNWVDGVSSTGTFVKNVNATWDVTGVNGIPEGWNVQIAITPTRCINLSITADDVPGRFTTTNIYWTAEVEGIDDSGNSRTVTFTGTDISESFPQNTSTTDTIERTISYTYMGVTATTTITHGVWISKEYTISLNDQWQSSSVVNPDSALYDGVYESFSNKGVNNTAAIMYIDINYYTDFDLYIRSYAESSCDYVMVSQLDQTIDNNTTYSNNTLIKAHTRGKQKSGTSIDNYTKVSFTGIDGGQHRITIVYRKDSSVNSGDDRGYILIPKNQ